MKHFRFLLLPLSLIYHMITGIRNWLYDKQYLKSFHLDIKTISVGNLTVGGTGKTPVVEYLIELMKGEYNLTTLSRGYKRKTKGMVIASLQDTARTIGDEPAQLYSKFGKEIGVAVCEDRLYAIPHILYSRPETNLVLLDDAFQHRRIIPTCNILLSDFNRPFYSDWLMPAGNLRESRKNANRADVVIVTKCPPDLTVDGFNNILTLVRKYIPGEVPVYFMNIHYADPVPFFKPHYKIEDNVILVTGIAQPKSLVDFIQEKYHLLKHFKFPDHHFYTNNDIIKILDCFQKNHTKNVSILFTEKDITRIRNSGVQDILMDLPVFFQPITYKFAHSGSEFNEFIQKVLVNTVD